MGKNIDPMKIEKLKKHIQKIVIEAQRLCATKTGEGKAPVNYACVFSQSEAEYQELVSLACQLGKIVQDTAMGPVFQIALLPTVAGKLELLKIRRPDSRRKEMGDADFTVANYENFKKKYLGKPGFSLIERPKMEMIELIDQSFNAVVYFSYPTLANILKI
jgi:hypothetical protein